MTWTSPMPLGLHGPNSLFTVDVTQAPLAEDSVHVAEHLNLQREQVYGGIVALNTHKYNVSVYTVDNAEPLRLMDFLDTQNKRYLPDIYRPGTGRIASAPLPLDAVPAPGTDGHLAVYQPTSGKLWEYWRAKRVGDHWGSTWGGRIDDLANSTGFYSGYEGVCATGAVAALGCVGIAELQAGEICHAIGLAITRGTKGQFSFPAVRADGNSTAADAIAEGRRFRLAADTDLTLCRTTPDWRGKTKPLHPIALMIARAAMKYGFIVTDQSYGLSIGCESGAGVQALTGVDPWKALLGTTKNYAVMDGFPWDKIEALPYDWGKGVSPVAAR